MVLKGKFNIIFIFLVLFSVFLFTCSPEIIDTGDTSFDVGPDNYEPDNDVNEATLLNIDETQSHTISPVEDIDYFIINAIQGKSYRIHFENILGFEPEVSLYDTDGVTVLEMKNTNTFTGQYDWWGYDIERNFVPEEKESIVFTPDQSGYYYLSIKDLYDAHDNSKYDITLEEVFYIVPINLIAEANNDNFSIDLTWDSIENVSSYRLYRTSITQDISDPNYDDFQFVASTFDTAFSDTTIQPNVIYYYYVTGYYIDYEGNPSNCDDAVLSLNIGDIVDLEANGNVSSLSIDISWTAVPNVQGYKLYKTDVFQSDINNPNYTDFNFVSVFNEPNYSDTNIDINTPYYYYVIPYILNEDGDPSNCDAAELNINVGEVQNFVASPNMSNLSIELSWDELTINGSLAVDSYDIYKTDVFQSDINNPNYTDFSLLTNLSGTTSYEDESVELNTIYYYYVVAKFQSVEGTPSNCDDAEIEINVNAPINLIATEDITNQEIDIVWDSVSGVDGYKLYRTDVFQSDINNPNYTNFTMINALTTSSYSDTSVELDTRYYYYVKAYFHTVDSDPSNCDDALLEITGTQDLVADPDPVNIEIDLSWSEIVGADGYNIYRTNTTQDINNPNYGDFSLITSLSGISNNTYSDSNILLNTRYYYYVIAYVTNPSNEQGTESNVDYATVSIEGPQNLIATPNALPNTSIDVTWDSVINADGYKVYRTSITQDINNPNYSDFTLIDNVTTNQCTDNSISLNTRYYYYVKAYNNSQDGNPSNCDDAVLSLGSPNNLIATPISSELQIDISWDDMVDVDGYRIYRTSITQDINNPNYSDFTLVDSVSINSYVDSSVVPNVTYYYYVRAYINNKNGSASNCDDAEIDWTSFRPKDSIIEASQGHLNKIDIQLIEKYTNSDIIRYEIYRANHYTDDPSTYVYIGDFLQTNPLGTTIEDTNVINEIYYWYCVRIVIEIEGTEYYSLYSYFDSGVASGN